MRYLNYYKCDTKNGEGVRCTLFVSGCELACRGCHNPESWKLTEGQPYTDDFEQVMLKDLSNPYIRGLTLTGGHPLHPKNFHTVLNLCKLVKTTLPHKDIWLWTGLRLEEIKANPMLKEILTWIDVLVDGRFEIDLRNEQVCWTGSSNQRVLIKEIGDFGEHNYE